MEDDKNVEKVKKVEKFDDILGEDYETISDLMIRRIGGVENTVKNYVEAIDRTAGIPDVDKNFKNFIKSSKFKFNITGSSIESYYGRDYDSTSFGLVGSLEEGINALEEQLKDSKKYFSGFYNDDELSESEYQGEDSELDESEMVTYKAKTDEKIQIEKKIKEMNAVMPLLEEELRLRYFGDTVLKNIDEMRFDTIKLNEEYFNDGKGFKEYVLQDRFNRFKELLADKKTNDSNLFIDYESIIEKYNPANLRKKDKAELDTFEKIVDKIKEQINKDFIQEKADTNTELIDALKKDVLTELSLNSYNVNNMKDDEKQKLSYLSKIKAKFANEKLVVMFLGVDKYKQNYNEFHKSVSNISKSDINEELYEDIQDVANRLDEQMLEVYKEMENTFEEQFNLILKIDHNKYPELTTSEIYEQEIENPNVKKQIELNALNFVDCVLEGKSEIAYSFYNSENIFVAHANPMKHKLEIISMFNLKYLEVTGKSILDSKDIENILESAFKESRQSANAAGEPIEKLEIKSSGPGYFKGDEQSKGVGYIFSENSKPLYEIGDDGKPKYITDEMGNRKYEIDEFTTDLSPKYELDEFGNRKFILDKRGNAIFGTNQKGQPTYLLNKNGEKLCDVDEKGYIKIVDGKDYVLLSNKLEVKTFDLVNEQGEKTPTKIDYQIVIDKKIIGYKFKQGSKEYFADINGNPLFKYGKKGEILHAVNGDLKYEPNQVFKTNIIKEQRGKENVLFLTDENGNKIYELDHNHKIKQRVNAKGELQVELSPTCSIHKVPVMEEGLNKIQSDSFIEMLKKGEAINAFREETTDLTETKVNELISQANKIYEKYGEFANIRSIESINTIQLNPKSTELITPQQQAKIDALTYLNSANLVCEAHALINNNTNNPANHIKQMEEFLMKNGEDLLTVKDADGKDNVKNFEIQKNKEGKPLDKDGKVLHNDVYVSALETYVSQVASKEEVAQHNLFMSYQQPEKKQSEMLFAHEYNGLIVQMSGKTITPADHEILDKAFAADINYNVLKRSYVEEDKQETSLDDNHVKEEQNKTDLIDKHESQEIKNVPTSNYEKSERVRGMRLRPPYYDLTVEDYESILASLDKAISNLNVKSNVEQLNIIPEEKEVENEKEAENEKKVDTLTTAKKPLKKVTLEDFKYGVINSIVKTTKDKLGIEIEEYNKKTIPQEKLGDKTYMASVENMINCQTLIFSERSANIELIEEMAKSAVRTSDSNNDQLDESRELLDSSDKKKTNSRLVGAKTANKYSDIKKQTTARELLTNEVQNEDLIKTVGDTFSQLTEKQKQFIMENGYEDFFSATNPELQITDELKALINTQADTMKSELNDYSLNNIMETNKKLEKQAETQAKKQAETAEKAKQIEQLNGKN